MVAAHAVNVQPRLPRAAPDISRTDDDGNLCPKVRDTLELGTDCLQSVVIENTVLSAKCFAAELDEHPLINRLCFHTPFNLRFPAAAAAAVFSPSQSEKAANCLSNRLRQPMRNIVYGDSAVSCISTGT